MELTYISEAARNWGFFSNRRKIVAESLSCALVGDAVLFSGLLSYVLDVAVGVLGRGPGGPIEEGPERAELMVSGNKGESGWLSV